MSKIVTIEELNKLPIQEARSAIISNLIQEYEKIDSQIKDLKIQSEGYQEDLDRAKASGDLSENSAYTNAIENLSSTFARILKYTELQYDIQRVEEPEFVYQTTGKSQLTRCIAEMNELGSDPIIDYLRANYGQDLSGMQDITTKECNKVFAQLNNIADDKDLYDLVSYKYITDIRSYARGVYLPIDRIVLYSAVNVSIDNENFTFVICPDNISFVSEGIVAANSRVGSSLLGLSRTSSQIRVQGDKFIKINDVY